MEIGYYQEIIENDGNIVRLVESIFCKALALGASDIHIEALVDCMRVRVRLDGLLVELCRLPLAKHNAILSRIKLISNMDIAEKRLPQDGRLSLSLNKREVDLRISSLPTATGEKLAIRILNKEQAFLELAQLGFSERNLLSYERLIHSANGLVLVTGPTGSGKTTTLYATLSAINNDSKNIVTIEDPVEYSLAGINQVAVNKSVGLDFNTALKTLVRQDPNIVMLGEIRDRQTAEFAIHAALTGHLVFSTLHTNSALGAIARLIDLGIEPFLLLSALRGVLAQRLVRRICPHCLKEYAASPLEMHCLHKEKGLVLAKGEGCSYCHNSGYAGRLAVQELLVMDDGLISMILHKAEESKQRAYLKQQGFLSLAADGVSKALQKQTTLEELLRLALI